MSMPLSPPPRPSLPISPCLRVSSVQKSRRIAGVLAIDALLVSSQSADARVRISACLVVSPASVRMLADSAARCARTPLGACAIVRCTRRPRAWCLQTRRQAALELCRHAQPKRLRGVCKHHLGAQGPIKRARLAREQKNVGRTRREHRAACAGPMR